ncbi:uncharacterized protein P174DRAFT_42655 [Aspergillus novofumigatus IBT 16806]|uniref:Zn(2)-C6 fungal-type domain-containing protein n=1 Tax=Aspergillus novofumigatus (strain IBT 16806) TaxID=1392255 RepID=A0A2I1CNN8_ASPN1|nr:uncharacterized protein P174DRAFT_42655 [Aspergillus novofumigatus IBT 16806]PKX99244.1 hypothetical protein P174DRAFT_42655 [Aspergillus novofumigatus IBT 16806]
MATTYAYERFPFHEPGSGPDSHFTTPESSLVGNSTAYESHHNVGLRRSSMGKCLLQWFWSTLMIDGSNTQDNQAKPSDLRHGKHHAQARKGSTFATQETSTAEQSHDDTDEVNPACKACRTWGVACDRQQPRCSHCLDQQILCFYVAPLRKTMKKSSRSRVSQQGTGTATPMHLQQQSCC